MSAGPVRFAVDLELLETTIGELESCALTYDELLADVRRRVAALHLTWTGQAAAAHAGAQADWEAGFARMLEALAVMRRTARAAHDNYTGAVEANVRTWRSV